MLKKFLLGSMVAVVLAACGGESGSAASQASSAPAAKASA